MEATASGTAREAHTTWALARLAGCGDPDRPDGVTCPADGAACEQCGGTGYLPGSAGAVFLRSVESAVLEAVENEEIAPGDDHGLGDTSDRVHEIADGAPDVYTYTRWQEFVDLAAWQEEGLDEFSEFGDGMTGMAGVALYMIAERLAWALLEELAEEGEEDDPVSSVMAEHGLTEREAIDRLAG